MASIRVRLDQAANSVTLALMPLSVRWNALEARSRRLVVSGVMMLATGLILAFVVLPAMRSRDALTMRLPQLEIQLAAMRSQANEVTALAREPALPIATRNAADVAALQSIFGPDARIAVAQDGFHIVIPAIAYASWWDRTGEAVSRHALGLQDATLTRIDGSATPAAALVAVDMRLSSVAGAAGSATTVTPAAQGK